jgi:hypothetical protein
MRIARRRATSERALGAKGGQPGQRARSESVDRPGDCGQTPARPSHHAAFALLADGARQPVPEQHDHELRTSSGGTRPNASRPSETAARVSRPRSASQANDRVNAPHTGWKRSATPGSRTTRTETNTTRLARPAHGSKSEIRPPNARTELMHPTGRLRTPRRRGQARSKRAARGALKTLTCRYGAATRGRRPRRATERPPSASASASVTSSSRTPFLASRKVIRIVAPLPSGISDPLMSDTRTVFFATAPPSVARLRTCARSSSGWRSLRRPAVRSCASTISYWVTATAAREIDRIRVGRRPLSSTHRAG